MSGSRFMPVPSDVVPVHARSVPMAGSAGSGSQPGRFPVHGSFSANYLFETFLQTFGVFLSVLGLCFVTSEPALSFPGLRI